MSAIQRRAFYRIDKEVLLEIRTEEKGDSRVFKSRTINISGGGIRIRLPEQLGNGVSVVCGLQLDKSRVLNMSGKVVWSKPVPDEGGVRMYETGIEFSQIDNEDNCEQIVKYVFDEQNKLLKCAREAEEAGHLWKQFAIDRSIEIRNRILLKYVYLVKIIVNRLIPAYKKVMEYDDVISCGVLGLIDAIDRYDPRRNVKFETYASIRIRGEIIDFMRKQDWAPLSVRNKIKKVGKAYSELEAQRGRSVTDEEVAAYLEMSVSDLQKTLEDSYTANILYLDEALPNLEAERMADEQGDEVSARFERKELNDTIARFIDELNEKERLVITMYYYEEMTLREIGMVLGVTESRVSQIHSRVLLKLRAKLDIWEQH